MRATTFVLTSTLTAFAAAASWSNVTAQSFYAMVPACVYACDVKALTHDGCDVDDFACHCTYPERIGEVIAPCLATTTCAPADLEAFANTVDSVCSYEHSVNSSIPWTNVTSYLFSGPHGPPSSNSSASGPSSTWSSNSTSTISPLAVYTGAASTAKMTGVGLAAVAMAAVLAL